MNGHICRQTAPFKIVVLHVDTRLPAARSVDKRSASKDALLESMLEVSFLFEVVFDRLSSIALHRARQMKAETRRCIARCSLDKCGHLGLRFLSFEIQCHGDFAEFLLDAILFDLHANNGGVDLRVCTKCELDLFLLDFLFEFDVQSIELLMFGLQFTGFGSVLSGEIVAYEKITTIFVLAGLQSVDCAIRALLR